MKAFSTLLFVVIIASASAFFSCCDVRPARISSPTARSLMSIESSRRAAMMTVAGILVATPAAMALVDADEDSTAMVRRIAAQSEAANAAARAKKVKEEEDAKNNSGAGQNLVAAGLVGSVALSLPFFLPNLIRLGKKLSSGGKNDGYGN